MKVIQAHNLYRINGGENNLVYAINNILKGEGINSYLFLRNSNELNSNILKKFNAFFGSIYSDRTARIFTKIIYQLNPDIVHVHNLYPLISPSILVACRLAGVPVVMTCHNFRLICPMGLHFRNGKICELCCNRKEYLCLINNCRNNMFESGNFALRNWVARRFRLITKNISLFIAISNFLKERLVASGLEEEKIVVLPNFVPIAESAVDASQGKYIAFAGRFSPEKGIDLLLNAARKLPQIPFRIAGDWSAMPELIENPPQNVKFMGWLDKEQLIHFYQNARIKVVPSKWFEPFGMVTAEAMSNGLPVIAARIGALPEIVEEGVTGLLFEADNENDLVNKIQILWNKPDYCRKLGHAGREKAIREYSKDIYLHRLLGIYEKVISR